MSNLDDTFWIYNPSILFINGGWHQFIPTPGMTFNQILNSITLFFIYLAILYFIFIDDKKYTWIPIIAIIVIVFIYFIYKPKIEPKQEIKAEILESIKNKSKNSKKKLLKAKKSSSDNREGFAHWLYPIPKKTCKEDSEQCLRYEDIRYYRENPKKIDN